MPRWNSCNVLKSEAQARQLWQFAGGKLNLLKAERKLPGEPLTENLIAKDWRTLFQPRLNIAWVPADKVFLRVLQLPKADAAETHSMVDLQLEKISPLPVAQIVWSYEVVPMFRRHVIGEELQPHATGELQTVIVIMASRSHVEEFLGQIEGQGYQPDRLELPQLDQLLGLKIDADGVWVLPGVGTNANACLVSWWYGGVLQYVSVLHLPDGPARATALQEQIAQTAWGGESEGWMTAEPAFKLVADEATAATWLPLFPLDQPVAVVPPAPAEALAQVTARRVMSNGTTTNLLPTEYTTRYRQQFIDRLWMRALGALVVLYLLGVVVYIGIAKVAEFRYDSLSTEVTQLGVSYTNALRLKEQMIVMQDTLDLQYAALECYKAIADNLPEELTLRSIQFDQGRKVTYSGTAAAEHRGKVLELNEKMHHVTMGDQPLFGKVNAPSSPTAPGGQTLNWSFACELKRGGGTMTSYFDKLGLSPQERRLVVIVGIVVFVVVNAWVIIPMFGNWGRYEQRIKDASAQRDKYNAEIGRQHQYEIKLKELQKQGMTVGSEEAALRLQQEVINQANLTGLGYGTISPSGRASTIKTNSFFDESSVNVAINTGEKELIDFLVRLADKELLIRAKSMVIGPDPQTQTKLQGTLTLVKSFQRKPPARAAAPPAAAKPASPKPPEAKTPVASPPPATSGSTAVTPGPVTPKPDASRLPAIQSKAGATNIPSRTLPKQLK